MCRKIFLRVTKYLIDTACCSKKHNLLCRKVPLYPSCLYSCCRFFPSSVSVEHLEALSSLNYFKWLTGIDRSWLGRVYWGWGEVCLFVCLVWVGLGFFVFLGFLIFIPNFTARMPLEELIMYPWDCAHINHKHQAMQCFFSKQSRNVACRVFPPNISLGRLFQVLRPYIWAILNAVKEICCEFQCFKSWTICHASLYSICSAAVIFSN